METPQELKFCEPELPEPFFIIFLDLHDFHHIMLLTKNCDTSFALSITFVYARYICTLFNLKNSIKFVRNERCYKNSKVFNMLKNKENSRWLIFNNFLS